MNLIASFGVGIYHGYNASKGVETGIDNIPSNIAIMTGAIQGTTHMLTSLKQEKYDRAILVPVIYMPAVGITGALIGEGVGRLASYAGL